MAECYTEVLEKAVSLNFSSEKQELQQTLRDVKSITTQLMIIILADIEGTYYNLGLAFSVIKFKQLPRA